MLLLLLSRRQRRGVRGAWSAAGAGSEGGEREGAGVDRKRADERRAGDAVRGGGGGGGEALGLEEK